MVHDKIIVRGAREHNLKNIDVVIPRDKFVVLTGISGSGKSSLAFDTIFAEGQRRYVESLSSYARQFLGQMDKPDVDQIEGLSPAISIDQKSTSHNPRSTVGTVTEIYDHLRLLYARIGHPHCPNCGREIAQQTVEQIVDAVQALPDGTKVMILGPLVRSRKGEYRHVFEEMRKAGYARMRVDGQVRDLNEQIDIDKNKKHDLEVVVDRLIIRHREGEEGETDKTRTADSVETALKLGTGIVIVNIVDGQDLLFSEHFACVHCNISLEEIAPRTFSFNNPHGACPVCTGLGVKMEMDPDLVVPNPRISIKEGAIMPWSNTSGEDNWYGQILSGVAKYYKFSLDTPWEQLTPEQQQMVLYGTKGQRVTVSHKGHSGHLRDYQVPYEGVITNLERRYKETSSDYIKNELEQYFSARPCPTCKGARLKPESLGVTVADRNIIQVSNLSITEAQRFFDYLAGDAPDPHSNGNGHHKEATLPAASVPAKRGRKNGATATATVVQEAPTVVEGIAGSPLSERENTIARQILKEIRARIGFLVNVGLDYLSLDRAANTLSGGEAQRIRLATQIGSSLMGVLYILDEPSIGLHQRDNARLIQTLLHLRDLGNTLLVVEHDEETMLAADHIVDVGPGAGEHGGYVVVNGTLQDVIDCPESITGQFLAHKRTIPVPATRRTGSGNSLKIIGARENNLKDITVEFPLGEFVVITGVSGSGKSSLITEILYKAVAQYVYGSRKRPGKFERMEGLEHLDKVIEIDQSPIGRTPRSNPATYTGVFTYVRELFAQVPESKLRGYKPGRFSFNVKGGRCEACHGEGIIQIEMHFLPDVYVPCEVCKGKRYNREALEIKYKDKSIADILEMTVEEGLAFFEHIPSVRNKLKTLNDVGLGYIHLGQPATTLSGGEAQRIKLASELSRRATGRTLYILDEPTTGLHFADVERLLLVLQRLADQGNSIVVIEHNLDVIKSADWIIDLGPEGGNKGGYVIAEGTPEQVAEMDASVTGQFLRLALTGARV